MVAAKASDHIEATGRDAAEHESRVASDRGFQFADGVAGQAVIVRDGAIERLGGGRRAIEGEALLVLGHRVSNRASGGSREASRSEFYMRGARDGNLTGESLNRESVKRRARRGSKHRSFGAERLGNPKPAAWQSRTRLGSISAVSSGLAEQT